jgi:hypothetical protein
MINQKERSRKYSYWHGRTIPMFIEEIKTTYKCRMYGLNWVREEGREYIDVPIYKTHYNGKKVLVHLDARDIHVNGCLKVEIDIYNNEIEKFERCLSSK